MEIVKTLRYGQLELHRITLDNLAIVRGMFENEPDSQELIEEMEAEYLPKYDEEKRLSLYGFYALLEGKLAGLSLLAIDSWPDARGSTGADILPHMRGRRVAPGSKPPLFYLGFELLGLNRIETGHFVSNRASKRSIEKTPGFRLEGLMREHGRNDDGEFEDALLYAILRRDWLELYQEAKVEVIHE